MEVDALVVLSFVGAIRFMLFACRQEPAAARGRGHDEEYPQKSLTADDGPIEPQELE